MRIRAATGGTYNTYVRVGVAGLSGAVTSATLRLFASSGGSSGGSVHTVAGSWTESGITYTNAPAITGSPLDSHGPVADNQWVDYDVTAAVTGNGVYNFGLKSGSTDSVYFSARETYGSQKPHLILTTTGGLVQLALPRPMVGSLLGGAVPAEQR